MTDRKHRVAPIKKYANKAGYGKRRVERTKYYIPKRDEFTELKAGAIIQRRKGKKEFSLSVTNTDCRVDIEMEGAISTVVGIGSFERISPTTTIVRGTNPVNKASFLIKNGRVTESGSG